MNTYKTTTVTKIEEVVIGKRCDCCGGEIKEYKPIDRNGYFRITTGHRDWGNDSRDSIEFKDACSVECARTAIESYLKDKSSLTSYIEIERERFVVKEWA